MPFDGWRRIFGDFAGSRIQASDGIHDSGGVPNLIVGVDPYGYGVACSPALVFP